MNGISQAEVERLLKSELKLEGDTAPLAALILEVAGYACDASTLLGLTQVLQASKIVQVATSGAVSVVGALLLIPALLIELRNSIDWGERQAGLVGVSWATVAWAFDDPMPRGPKSVVEGFEDAYDKAFNARCAELDEIVMQSRVERTNAKKAHQLALKLVGRNSRQGLWAHMSKAIEKDLSGVALATWPLIQKYDRYPVDP